MKITYRGFEIDRDQHGWNVRGDELLGRGLIRTGIHGEAAAYNLVDSIIRGRDNDRRVANG